MLYPNYLRLVKHVKDDFSEEIPEKISPPLKQQPASKSKWRKAWFRCVSSVLVYGVRKSYLPLAYMNTFHQFHQRNRETDFQQRDTTKKDIDYANRILDDIIEELLR